MCDWDHCERCGETYDRLLERCACQRTPLDNKKREMWAAYIATRPAKTLITLPKDLPKGRLARWWDRLGREPYISVAIKQARADRKHYGGGSYSSGHGMVTR